MTVAVGTDADPPALVAPFVAEQLANATLERFNDLTHFVSGLSKTRPASLPLSPLPYSRIETVLNYGTPQTAQQAEGRVPRVERRRSGAALRRMD
ncbi:MAG: hypothetical protein OXG34_08120 [bacterium]|nr:hypothetical protein [bacterium]MCY3888575.1 hypothetical protein [bacterium]MCY3961615.1 hypothetical protein [bacterium]MCY4133319.1 hypothetical protein [bacterium]